MKKLIRKIARSCGIDIGRYRPANSVGAQLLFALNHADIDLVFDIGANKGQFGTEILDLNYSGKIVSFEPLSTARVILERAAARVPTWIVHDQCAIGGHDGCININIAGNSVSSSVLPMLDLHSSAAEGSKYVASESVPIFKLDSIAARYLANNPRLFIKIDTQGYEWQVLDGAAETLRLASGVLCEMSLVPLYEGQRLWRDIIDRLERDGFMLWALQKGFTDPRTGQSLQMDGIFLNRGLLGFGKSQ